MSDHFEIEDMMDRLVKENKEMVQEIKNIRYLLGLGDWVNEATKGEQDEKEKTKASE